MSGIGIHPGQLRELVAASLDYIGYGGRRAVELLMLTAAAESRMGHYLRQVGGPARGVWQMEPRTENDIWGAFLLRRPALARRIAALRAGPNDLSAVGSLPYQAAMARAHYLRVPEPLPAHNDVPALAAYWKKHYNTHLGKGSPEKAVDLYLRLACSEEANAK